MIQKRFWFRYLLNFSVNFIQSYMVIPTYYFQNYHLDFFNLQVERSNDELPVERNFVKVSMQVFIISNICITSLPYWKTKLLT